MPTLSESALTALLQPYLSPSPIALPENLYPQLSLYLDLLLKWNARTNLTAIRDPHEIVRRHFGESLFAACNLGRPTQTLLDFGSGAGFPGLPIAILRPDIHVTLAESQNKKATFLREVVRALGLRAEIWSGRVETMPETTQFDTVTLRAVDNMPAALAAAAPRATQTLLLLTTTASPTELPPPFTTTSTTPIPGSLTQHLLLANRTQPT